MKKIMYPAWCESKVTLITRDALTGRLCQKVDGHNFIANQTIRFAQWVQRNQYKTGLSTIGSSDTDYSPHDAVNGLVLTDSALAENPSAEWIVPGTLIGYATKSAYAGADIYRGTPSITQLDAQPTYTKWVFDWPTNAAVGTINSVGWAKRLYADSGSSGSGPFFTTSLTKEQSWSTPYRWKYFARSNSSQAFGVNGTPSTVVYVLDSAYAQQTTFNVNGQFTAIEGIAWDSVNSFLWVIGANSSARRIAAYSASGVLQTGPFATTTRSYIALAHDGTNLWSITQNSYENHTAWCLNSSNGNDVSNFTFNTYRNNYPDYSLYCNRVCGLAWDPTYSRLWVRTTYNQAGTNDNNGYSTRAALYSFNTSGNKQTPDISLTAYTPSTTSFDNTLWYPGSSYDTDFDIIDSSQFAMPHPNNNVVYRVRADGLGTRALLPSPVAKTNTQTLKVIYQINYS